MVMMMMMMITEIDDEISRRDQAAIKMMDSCKK
jgi:hypothetical protein